MKTSPEVTDILRLFSKYRGLILKGTALSLAMFMVAVMIIPKKYKAHFTLSIYSQYFQNPLLRDFVPEIYDTSEMKSQRESLIRQALTPEFLDSLDDRYGIVRGRPRSWFGLRPILAWWRMQAVQWGLFSPPGRDIPGESETRKQILSLIDVESLNNSTFQVGFVNKDPNVTYHVVQDIYAQVIKTLQDSRTNNLTSIRDAIRKRLETLAFTMAASPDPRASLRPQLVRDELADVRNQIHALSTRYTDAHPLMQELKDREQILLHWAGNTSGGRPVAATNPAMPLVGGEPRDATYEIYKDLMRKLNYLNIALESDQAHQTEYFATLESPFFPTAPLWPKKSIFALWGLAAGLLGTFFISSIREYFERSAVRVPVVAQQLRLDLLGKLPHIPWDTLPRNGDPKALAPPRWLG
jgi:hypothetical protein